MNPAALRMVIPPSRPGGIELILDIPVANGMLGESGPGDETLSDAVQNPIFIVPSQPEYPGPRDPLNGDPSEGAYNPAWD